MLTIGWSSKIIPTDATTKCRNNFALRVVILCVSAEAGGERIRDTPRHRELFTQVVNAGFEVASLKGYTNQAIATATCMVIEAVAYDEYRTMPLATQFDDWLGYKDNCFSIPVVVGRQGIIRHLQPEISVDEHQTLSNAAQSIKKAISSLVPDLVD